VPSLPVQQQSTAINIGAKDFHALGVGMDNIFAIRQIYRHQEVPGQIVKLMKSGPLTN